MTRAPEFTLLFDHACPFCRREVEWLLRRDRQGRLAAIDIADPAFAPERYGLTRSQVVAELHGILPDGTVTRGMDSMRRAWRAAGVGWVLAPTGWPILRLGFDLAYRVFARWRVPLGRLFGRRCEAGACHVDARR